MLVPDNRAFELSSSYDSTRTSVKPVGSLILPFFGGDFDLLLLIFVILSEIVSFLVSGLLYLWYNVKNTMFIMLLISSVTKETRDCNRKISLSKKQKQ